MKIMKKICISILILGAAWLVSCQDADVIKPYGSTEKPKTVAVTDVVNGYGRSVIYYKLPDDNNLHYVKAVFTPRPGEQAEVNASFLTDSLVLSGFKEAGNCKVELYSVSYGGTYSDPVTVTVSPDIPPYQLAVQTLNCAEGFGGITVESKNPTEANLIMTVTKLDEDGAWKEISTRYTSAADVRFSVRGQDAVPSTFRVTVKDRWGSSMTSEDINLTPILEIECDKTRITGIYGLPGDNTTQHTSAGTGGIYAAFDGIVGSNLKQDFQPSWHTAPNSGMPQHFTFDMGGVYVFSRLLYHPRHIYTNGHPRRFEIYGAMELNPDPDRELYDVNGVLDPYWTLLETFESHRPSGSTVPASSEPLTTDDQNIYYTGEEFEFPVNVPPVRYVRYRTLETWGSVTYVEIVELTFFGTEITSDGGD